MVLLYPTVEEIKQSLLSISQSVSLSVSFSMFACEQDTPNFGMNLDKILWGDGIRVWVKMITF